ncbi:MAG: site-specific integrase [Oligoflexia bacterium]|nr:site-specific integrase [Oligoflexia bacterium]
MKCNPRTPTYWTKNEVIQFLNANKNSPLFELYLLALNTGMRRGELLGLRWDKVDLNDGRIEIARTRDRYELKETTKTRKIRYIFIRPEIVEVLRRHKERELNKQYVFVLPDGRPINIHHLSERTFKADIRHAGVKVIRFHDLRTTFCYDRK